MNKRVRKEIKFPDLVGRRITRLEEKRDFLLSSLVTRPDLLTEFNNVLNTAIAADGLGERDELTVQYFQLALELGVAHFISAFELPVDYGVTYLGTTYPYSKKRSRSYTDAGTWLNLVHLAVILRNNEALQILCGIPTSWMADSEIHSDEADLAFVDFMKGVFNPETDIGLLLVKAMEATDPEGMHPGRADYILNIFVPVLALYRCFLSDEEEEFAEKLNEALESHESRWSKEPGAPAGWISLTLVAVLALAYMNKGWTVPVESDYIPQWLVTGKYL